MKISRNWFMLLSMPVSILALYIISYLNLGWKGAVIWSLGFAAIYFSYAVLSKDKMLLHFLLFTMIAGITELWADKWIVETNTLFYPEGEPMLVDSPMYMPLSWVVVLMQIGYIAHLIHQKHSLLLATVAAGILGCLIIPLYEFLAIHAGWWHYANTSFWGIVPKYIYLAEGLLMLTVPILFERSQKSKPILIIVLGVVQGIIMLLASMVSYAIFKH